MGEHNVNSKLSVAKRAKFIKYLLDDIAAFELMLHQGQIEDDIIRIGAEQEFCLVDPSWRPTLISEKILEEINDPHFTTELAKFNLEINLDPIEFTGDCFSVMHDQLKTLLQKAKEHAENNDNKIILTGILPTISKTELQLDYMTPMPRYWALNEMLKAVRGKDFQLHLKGVDELTIKHDSVLFEACNTSFQMHLQIHPKDFVSSFNWAQAITGPVLGISTNSPLLLGRELWSETRIALFRQSIDTRQSSYALKDEPSRVAFGNEWAKGSVVEIFKDSVAQYKVILDRELETNSLEELKNGRVPKLNAMNLHHGTIYPWNRACYGVGNGKAHVRIENRYIPSGPSTIDEMATFVFWAGVMTGRPAEFDDMPSVMDFRDAKSNFIKAARMGKDAILTWKGKRISVRKLIMKELLPIAENGLRKAGVNEDDIKKYLGVIRRRTEGRTGSRWMISNYRELNYRMNKDSALRLLNKEMHRHQQSDKEVNSWPQIDTKASLIHQCDKVGHIMSTYLFTVKENDLATLATQVMEWKNVHHVPVENERGKLSGLLTWTHVQNFMPEGDEDEQLVSDIMVYDVVHATPETPISEAIKTMKEKSIGCMPVIQQEELVGIITIKDVTAFDND